MYEFILIVYALGSIGGPIAGFTRAARDPEASRLALFAGAIIGGAATATIVASLLTLNLALSPAAPYAGADDALTLVVLPIVTCLPPAALVGGLGILARSIGSRRSRRA